MSFREIDFDCLENSDLIVDAIYRGGMFGNVRDDPLSKLMHCGNQGGFRIVGETATRPALAVLYSSLDDPDWPDNLDPETGLFTYYGDNKSPGHELHDTPRKGNNLLRACFDFIHSVPPQRQKVPPFFVFTKGVKGRDVIFRGLAVPGFQMVKPTEDLVAIWKTKGGERFQNYKAYFTILNVPLISRKWIEDLWRGNSLSQNCPNVWRTWIQTGNYDALRAEPTITYRKKIDQMPKKQRNKEFVDLIYEYFRGDPFGFEHCAAKIVALLDKNVVSCDVTRPWRDGGRDALGLYRIGSSGDNIKVEFALEAKCFKPDKGVGIKHTSRLISRLKHREFGIFVTTSYVAEQAYREIREDGHPVFVISGNDIADILVEAGIGSTEKLGEWLRNTFPKT
jgi:hypothetical protein